MSVGVMPKGLGSNDELFMSIFAIGAVALSHPFEVARILMVKNDGGRMMPTLKSLYQSEGLAGLYKGFIPRSIVMVPTLIGAAYMLDPSKQFMWKRVEGFSDKQPTLEEYYQDKRESVRIFE